MRPESYPAKANYIFIFYFLFFILFFKKKGENVVLITRI